MLRDDSGVSRLRANFPGNRLYCGGNTRQEVISIIHRFSAVGGTEIVPGIYLGGHERACDSVEKGDLDPSSFKFFSGCEVWPTNALKSEVEDGLWYVAAASRAVILKQCISLPVPLWAEVLRLMGGKYHDEAKRAYGQE